MQDELSIYISELNQSHRTSIKLFPKQNFLTIQLKESSERFDIAIRIGILKFLSRSITMEYKKQDNRFQFSKLINKNKEIFLLEKEFLLPNYRANENDNFQLMIRQVNSLTEEFFKEVYEKVLTNNYHPILKEIQFITVESRLCIQAVHTEASSRIENTLEQMDLYLEKHQYEHADHYFREIYMDIDQRGTKANPRRIVRSNIRKRSRQ